MTLKLPEPLLPGAYDATGNQGLLYELADAVQRNFEKLQTDVDPAAAAAGVICSQLQGGLPLAPTFSVPAGTYIITFGGSGFVTAAAGLSAIDADIDGNTIGSARMYFNNANEHLAMTTCSVSVTLAAGLHTLNLVAGGGGAYVLNTDTNDFFTATWARG